MVGTVVPIPIHPAMWYNRGYISYVVIDVDAHIAPVFTGTSFTFRDSINVDWVLRVRNNVYDWSSNSYSLAWMIDENLSSVTIAGTPVIDGFYVDIERRINERFWGLWIQPGGLPGTRYIFPLPPAPPDYWFKGF